MVQGMDIVTFTCDIFYSLDTSQIMRACYAWWPNKVSCNQITNLQKGVESFCLQEEHAQNPLCLLWRICRKHQMRNHLGSSQSWSKEKWQKQCIETKVCSEINNKKTLIMFAPSKKLSFHKYFSTYLAENPDLCRSLFECLTNYKFMGKIFSGGCNSILIRIR